MELPAKPKLPKNFSPYNKPLRPTKPKETYKVSLRDEIVEEELYDGSDVSEFLAGLVLAYPISDGYRITVNTCVKYGDAIIGFLVEKITWMTESNAVYDEELETYKTKLSRYNQDIKAWKASKKIYDEGEAERKRVKDLNELERLQKKYKK